VIRYSKQADERREAGAMECWCLHGAVGMAADFREFAKLLAARKTSSRAVDLWRFLDCEPMPIADFGRILNAEAGGEVLRGRRALLGYSMGGRLALHALLEKDPPWQAAVIISANPGLESPNDRESRRASDAEWATRALTGEWPKFINDWNAQPILASATLRASPLSSSLIMRRREIARSFVDWSLGAQQPLWDALPEIQVPVLWVVGENDSKYLELARRAVEKIPAARLTIAPGCGHRVPWENPDWLAAEVANFLEMGS
jgi:2-succinyl-6-hydroxy-2,4-cyclohexadiene-1-carboxylate synthase